MIERIEISSLIRKKTLGLTFVLSAASFAFAQQKINISGKVIDNQNHAIPYASVTFSHPTNKLFSDAVLTDDKGIDGYFLFKLNQLFNISHKNGKIVTIDIGFNIILCYFY
jgi:hypothetical protein